MIIGITGTLGAGKGTVVGYLVEKHSFKHFSVRDFLNKEVERRGLPSNRDTLLAVANDLRATHGPGYISEAIMGKALRDGTNAVIESIRSIGEADYLRSHGAQLWAVDADIKIRYARILHRASETDHISLEKFSADEQREYANVDITKSNLSGVIALADVLLYNDGSKEELFIKIEEALDAK
ncbi:MAG TPA: AAA family ATPase [Candidatus Paceibacterota bacterium]|nr:AAA family ATPase [Candidatus Paceibacterota bacterium]